MPVSIYLEVALLYEVRLELDPRRNFVKINQKLTCEYLRIYGTRDTQPRWLDESAKSE